MHPRRAAVDSVFPNLGNLDLDVAHYELDLDYDVPNEQLEATATIRAEVLTELDELTLDFQGLTADAATLDGRDVPFREARQKLVLDTGTIAAGQPFELAITYHGNPEPVPTDALDGVEVGWHSSPEGSFVLSEPEGASGWFPNNNHPRDKATYTITVTVPDPFEAIASGELEELTEADGRRTYRWDMDKPMASYLATVVTGEFVEHVGPEEEGVAFSDWFPAHGEEDVAADRASATKSQAAVDDLVPHLGPFPFDTYGAVVYPITYTTASPRTQRFLAGVALETQGRSLYSPGSLGETAVHETAHQWMGDSVSVMDWGKDIWWVEGYATYAQNIGLPAATRDRQFRNLYGNVRDEWVPPGQLEAEQMFTVSYSEGSIVLYALEQTIGRETFTAFMKELQSRFRYGNMSTDDLIGVAEDVSGEDLGDFFQGWLFDEEPPPLP